jgi:hypothetical protein
MRGVSVMTRKYEINVDYEKAQVRKGDREKVVKHIRRTFDVLINIGV